MLWVDRDSFHITFSFPLYTNLYIFVFSLRGINMKKTLAPAYAVFQLIWGGK